MSWFSVFSVRGHLSSIQTDNYSAHAFSAHTVYSQFPSILLSDRFAFFIRKKPVLLENNLPLGPVNRDHSAIRSIGKGQFSVWGNHILFAASDNTNPVTNGRKYEITYYFSVSPNVCIILFLGLITVLFVNVSHMTSVYRKIITSIGALLVILTITAVSIFLLLYLSGAVYAYARGYALFLAWPLYKFPYIKFLHMFNASLPALLTASACLGWYFSILTRKFAPDMPDIAERFLSRFFMIAGIPVIIAVFCLATGCIWHDPATTNGCAVSYAAGGIVPLSDAAGHFGHNKLFQITHIFDPWVMRRPLAAAMRIFTFLISGKRPSDIIFFQTILLAIGTWFLCRSLYRFFGIYSAICAAAGIILYSKNLQATFAVNAFGVFWACVAGAWLVDYIHIRKIPYLLFAVASLFFSLTVRMGAMFLIPALFFWIIYIFRMNKKKVILASAGFWGVGLIIFLSSTFILICYSAKDSVQGSNFSYTLAGLSANTDWSTAFDTYRDKLNGLSEGEASKILYIIALKNILSKPFVLITALFLRGKAFILHAVFFLPRGWNHGPSTLLFYFLPFAAFMRIRENRDELILWALLLSGVTLSAAVVFPDEGPRVLAAGYIFIYIFLSTGLVSKPRSRYFGLEDTSSGILFPVLCSGLMIMIMFSPLIAVFTQSPEQKILHNYLKSSNTTAKFRNTFLGGEYAAVLLIVSNQTEVMENLNVPAMPESTLKKSLIAGGIIPPAGVTPPFGIMFSPSYPEILITPPETAINTGIKLWCIKSEAPQVPYSYIRYRIITSVQSVFPENIFITTESTAAGK